MTLNRSMFVSLADIHEVLWSEMHRGCESVAYGPEVDIEYPRCVPSG